MIIREVTDQEKTQFDQLAEHPVQSWEWGEFRKKAGNKVLRVGMYDQNKLKEGYLLTLHKIPKINSSVGMFTQGSVPKEEMLEGLLELGKRENLAFIRMEPRAIVNTPQKYNPEDIEKLLRKHRAVPGRPFFNKSTFWVDLTKSEEDLLKAMHPKIRYNIRVAERHGVQITEDNSPKAFETYLQLMDETTRRQKYFAHTEKYHRLMWEVLSKSGIAHLFTAKYQDKILSTWILFKWHGFLYYPYGASSSEHREVMASTLMMWEAIKFGKKLGLKTFDLWGGDEGKGYTQFKENFGPQKIDFIGTWDLVINSKLHRIYRIAEDARWRLLKLKARIFPTSSFR